MKRTALRPAKKRRNDLDFAAARKWHDTVTSQGCAVCPALGEECDGVIQAHHVLRAQFVRGWVDAHAHERALERREREELERWLMWDTANGMSVCYRAHRRHHNRVQPIPLALVPPPAVAFAAALGLAHRLERDYA